MSLSTLLSSILVILFTQSTEGTTTTNNGSYGIIYTSTIDTETMDMDCLQSDCSNKELDASSQTHLTLKCGATNCQSSTVYCPTVIDSSCDILCVDEDACKSVIVWANDTDILTIDCQALYSCRFMKVHANYASNITINAQYHHSFGSAQIWASNAGSLDIICVAGNDDSACGDSIFNIGLNGLNTHFLCYGTGCKDIDELHYLYDYETYLESYTMLSVDTYYCDQCSYASECFGRWSIACDNSNGADTFYGSKCSTLNSVHDTYCGCDNWLNRIRYSDERSSYCIYTETDSTPATITSTIISLLVLAVCCGFLFYYIKHGRYNRYSPAAGARPATMQAVSQPQQVVMQPQPQPQQMVMQQQVAYPQQVVYPQQMVMQQQYIHQAVPQQQVQYYPQPQAVTQPLQPQYIPASAPPPAAEGVVTNQ